MAPLPPASGRDLSRPRAIRVFRAFEFSRVRTKGVFANGTYFRMIALPVATEDNIDSPGNESRVGIVTSRRVGPAVTRNLVRRRLREIHRLGRLNMKPGFWIVVDVRRAAADASFWELQREWLRHAKKLSILRTS